MISTNNIPAYILFASHETNRKDSVALIENELSNLTIVEPIFAKYQKIPFLNKLITLSKARTGKALSPAEVSVLLSHRLIWQKIIKAAKDNQSHFLILESDSKLNNPQVLKENFYTFTKDYDLFFWGAWDGNTRIKKSTIQFKVHPYSIGEPLIKSVYCTYGYSLNKKAAAYLLKATNRISYPVDIYKKFIQKGQLTLGATRPEIIGAWYDTPSTVQKQSKFIKLRRFIIVQVFDFRNRIQAYFS